jgi:RHS repeat-associated protein
MSHLVYDQRQDDAYGTRKHGHEGQQSWTAPFARGLRLTSNFFELSTKRFCHLRGHADQHLTWKGRSSNGDLTGLYYVRNCWHEPEGGRFVNEDPAGSAGGFNLHSDGKSSELGLWVITAIVGIGFGIGAGLKIWA